MPYQSDAGSSEHSFSDSCTSSSEGKSSRASVSFLHSGEQDLAAAVHSAIAADRRYAQAREVYCSENILLKQGLNAVQTSYNTEKEELETQIKALQEKLAKLKALRDESILQMEAKHRAARVAYEEAKKECEAILVGQYSVLADLRATLPDETENNVATKPTNTTGKNWWRKNSDDADEHASKTDKAMTIFKQVAPRSEATPQRYKKKQSSPPSLTSSQFKQAKSDFGTGPEWGTAADLTVIAIASREPIVPQKGQYAELRTSIFKLLPQHVRIKNISIVTDQTIEILVASNQYIVACWYLQKDGWPILDTHYPDYEPRATVGYQVPNVNATVKRWNYELRRTCDDQVKNYYTAMLDRHRRDIDELLTEEEYLSDW